jgi:hypothetical protein
MSTRTIAALALTIVFSSPVNAQDACETLASTLHQDTVVQGTSLEQFAQFKSLVSNNDYKEWSNASSESHTFNGGLSIPNEVDIALGDGKKSDESSWESRRQEFLRRDYLETSLLYRSSSHVSQTNVAAIRAIADCAEHLANREGVFTQLVSVSPDRTAFAIKLWRNTSGGADWKLKNLSPQPIDGADFGCDNGWERASNENQLDLKEQGVLIECHKNPNKHVIVTVQTTAGPGGSFDFESIDEKIKKLQIEFSAQIQQLQTQINTLTTTVATINKETEPVRPGGKGCILVKAGDVPEGFHNLGAFLIGMANKGTSFNNSGVTPFMWEARLNDDWKYVYGTVACAKAPD